MLSKKPQSVEHEIIPVPDLDNAELVREEAETVKTNKSATKDKTPVQRPRNFVPIIMSFMIMIILGSVGLFGQIQGGIGLQVGYTDNVFQLSDYDLDRFDDAHPNFKYVDTSDDLSLTTNIDLSYPLRYKWWRFTPSVTANISQNVSNTRKYKRDAVIRMRVDRYYWNATVLYGYYPDVYIRDYVDTDGTGKLESYAYAKDLWRADLNIKPWKNTTLRANIRYEEFLYNQYFTEFDGDAKTYGLGIRQNFPLFVAEGMYGYRVFDNWENDIDPDDSSYESNIYTGSIRLKPMPLNDSNKQGAKWYPSLRLSFEERFYQSADNWYGGRIDKVYRTEAGLNFDLNRNWNITLDYSHALRNVDSPNASVRRLRPYSENRIDAEVKYNF